jgi:hypothetical protein
MLRGIPEANLVAALLTRALRQNASGSESLEPEPGAIEFAPVPC